eukprot:1142682-Pyramimonas_sp.AAC.1
MAEAPGSLGDKVGSASPRHLTRSYVHYVSLLMFTDQSPYKGHTQRTVATGQKRLENTEFVYKIAYGSVAFWLGKK